MNEIQREKKKRLVSGESLDGLNPARIDGRIDMRGVSVAGPIVTRTLQTPIGEARVLSGPTIIRNGSWRGLDFTGATLPRLRFFDSSLTDCIFDRCDIHDIRVWTLQCTDCRFLSAVVSGSLGPARPEGSTYYRNVDFTGADLRDTSYNSTVFVNCLFRNTRLTKVEFWGSNFTDCVFEGELREVIFSRDGLPRGQNPPNEMINVDLRKAKLRMCGFRKLNLDRVLFPEDDEHIILDQYPETVDRLLEQLAARTESGWLGVAGLLEWDQKCVGPRQRFGVWSKQDIVAEVGEDGLSEFLGWVQAWGVPRSAQEVNAMDPKDRLLP